MATDFANGHVDVFDGDFHRVDLPETAFHDRDLPKAYAPFGVIATGSTVYVSYAKQQPGSTDEAHGVGLGFVDRYTNFGLEVERIASHGTLNAPWGMTIAPVAHASDLGFIPFAEEHYDFALVTARKQRAAVQAFLDALASDEGRAALAQAGFRPA